MALEMKPGGQKLNYLWTMRYFTKPVKGQGITKVISIHSLV